MAENILSDPHKLTNMLLILFAVFFGIVAIVAFTEQTKQSFFGEIELPEDGFGENETGKPQCPDQFECCTGRDYEEKSCPEFKACVNNSCVGQSCPFECCEGDKYKNVSCPGGLVCKNNNCVRDSCPFECCLNEPKYRDKFCFENKECVNNSCELKICDNECCVDKTGYEDKLCSGTQECSGGTCIKPECPARCCLPTDQDYQQKDCPSHSKCVGRVCVPKI